MMKALNYALKLLCNRNRDGSFAKQTARERILTLIANQLEKLGFRNLAIDSLKPKHVTALVEQWKGEGLASGTVKNRMAEIRWWSEKVGKQNVVARSNDYYGIDRRQFVTNESKARTLDASALEKVRDPYTHLSLRLQAEFGLRREESIKLRPVQADHGDRLVLQASKLDQRRTRTGDSDSDRIAAARLGRCQSIGWQR